ncbi:hypothetical protein AHAS_Ahas18G0186200 [Arachis hypogaea]
MPLRRRGSTNQTSVTPFSLQTATTTTIDAEAREKDRTCCHTTAPSFGDHSSFFRDGINRSHCVYEHARPPSHDSRSRHHFVPLSLVIRSSPPQPPLLVVCISLQQPSSPRNCIVVDHCRIPKGSRHRDFEGEENYESLYMHLNDKSMSNSIDSDSVSSVTLFSGAGIFSWMSFWGLNPLMKGGKQKTLQKKDIPKLHEADRAESCYFRFQEQLNKQKMKEQLAQQPSLLQTIIMCHWKEIVISGFFSLLKVITLPCGPFCF